MSDRDFSKTEIFCYFIKEKRKNILVYCTSIGIFFIVGFLYKQVFVSIIYPVILSILFGFIVLGVSFFKYYDAHIIRKKLLNNIEISYDNLEFPFNLMEQDYYDMLKKMGNIIYNQKTDWQNESEEALYYYMAWVHQIKTPIAVMKMILQNEDTKEHRELLSELFRIEQYAEMALSYIRLGIDNNDLLIKTYKVDDIIRQAIRKYASQFIRRKIKLLYQGTDEEIVTDEKWMLFIIEQLLSNAIKYTNKGYIKITVLSGPVILIEDTGIGIAPEDLPRIFEKGFTGYNGRADKKATGLGLYLSTQAANKIGLKIEADSVISKGSVFTIKQVL